jgi:iron complex outermembrane receptor protein
MQHNSLKFALYLTTAVTGLLGAAPAFAESAAAAAAPQTLDEIVVTARRTQERLQDVPISITVYNQSQISKLNMVNPQDLARYTPSLSANTNFGNDNTAFAIRGFVQDIGTAPSVGVYFGDVVTPRGASNGIPVGDGANVGDFWDLQNVQVLKGPQGTLFGRNTTGGAILFVPQKPTNKYEGYVEGTAGDYGLLRITGVANLPVNDRLRIRLGVDHQSRDGYANNTSGIGPSDFYDVNYTAARISVVYDITPDLENYFIGSYLNSNTNGTVQKLIAADPSISLGSFGAAQLLSQAKSGFYDLQQDYATAFSKLKQWQIINTTTWRESEHLTVKNIFSYAQLTDDLRSAIFGTNFATPAIPPLGLPSFPFGFTGSVNVPGGHTANQSTLTEELQFQGNALDNKLTWQAGGYMEISNPLSTVGSQSPVVASCTNSDTFQCYDILGLLGTLASGVPQHSGAINLTIGQTQYKDYAVYAQATYRVNDQLRFTGGIRWTHDEEKNWSDQKTYVLGYPISLQTFQPIPPSATPFCTNPQAPPATCTLYYKETSSKPTWLLDVDYNVNPNVMMYAKYARGYRAGTIAPNVTSPYNYVQPEKVNTYEIGLKSSFDGLVRGTFNFAGFYNDFSNQQLQLGFDAAPGAPVAPTAAPINAGKSRILGAEIETRLILFQGFTLSMGYTWLDTEILSIPHFVQPAGALYVINGAQQVGDQLALSPRDKVTVTVDYALPVDASLGKIDVGATFTHTDQQIVNYNDRTVSDPAINGLGTLPGTNILDFNANWDSIAGKPIDLQAFVTNVTGLKYYTWVPGIAPGTGFETAALGAPRMFGFRLRYRFGS